MVPQSLQLLLGLGRPLFPCSNANKKPLTRHGFKDASNNPDTIAKWHHQHPACAWGMPTSSEYAVVDIDPRNGGTESIAALVERNGDIPHTPTVETGSGGWHHYMVFPSGTRCGKLGAGIDLKADGGYVIVPPSRILIPEHHQAYRWTVRPWEVDPAPAPEWLIPKANPVSLLCPDAQFPAPLIVGGDADIRTHPGCREGERRVTLCRLAGTAIGQGHDTEQVREWAKAWAERCAPPFAEWETHFRGLVRKEGQKVNNPPTPSPCLAPAPDGGEGSQQVSKQVSNPPVGEGGEGDTYLLTCLLDDSLSVPGTAPTPFLSIPVREPDPVSELVSVEGEEVVQVDPFALSPDAYHGVLGEVVKAVSPHTEADNPAVLVCLLTAFGSAVGFAPHFDHGKRHGGNLFVGLVGPTATRKGTANGIAKAVIAEADPEWACRVQHEGFGSGEGLIWNVRDPNHVDPVGIPDKRLMVIEEEWAKAFTLSASDKSILTPIIRNAFDRIPIGKANKGDNAYRCERPHISIVGHITPDDLRQSLTGKMAVSIANGFVNRFLLVATRKTKFLPRGGHWKQHAEPFIPAIRDAIGKAKTRSLMVLEPDAEPLWDFTLYPALETRPEGVAGAATARASDMVMKLALIYALADGDDLIRVPHLRAGLAVWRYCEATAFALFRSAGVVAATGAPEPDPLFLRLLNAIKDTPGVKRSELTIAFKNTDKADGIASALDWLKGQGMAYPVKVKGEAGGAPAERWYPGGGGGGGDGEKPNNTLSLTNTNTVTSPPNPFAGLVVGGEGKEVSKQVSKYPPDPDAGEGELLTCLLPYCDTPPDMRIPITEKSARTEPPTIGITINGEGVREGGGESVVQVPASDLDLNAFLDAIDRAGDADTYSGLKVLGGTF